MRKLWLALTLALFVAACESGNPVSPERAELQPADGECDIIIRPC